MLTLSQIKGVGDATIKKLQELGIKSVFELFSFLPSKYIDLQLPVCVSEAEPNVLNLFEGTVEKIGTVSPRGKRAFGVSFSDNLSAGRKLYFKTTFYNMPFLHDSLQVGDSFRLLGKISKDSGTFNIVNPQLEKLEKISKLQGIYTIYPLKGILGQNAFKNVIYNALEQISNTRFDGVLASVNYDLIKTFYKIHKPASLSEAEDAKDLLASIDMAIALSIYKSVTKLDNKSRRVFYNFGDFIIDDYVKCLPYTPTKSQVTAFEDIFTDLSSNSRMSRIISGDVGSGKTSVAFFAMTACALGGHQCALMVPTEILAKQHFEKFKAIADNFGLKCSLLTSSVCGSARKTILQGLQSGQLNCVIGTQSLISEEIRYKNLSLAIIDEQHKFGVRERNAIESKGASDILSLTATPIPRSMALTFYDDIAISFINKRESARSDIITSVVDSIDEAVSNIILDCKRGKQAFIVCPSISDAEGYDLISIEKFLKEFRNRFDGLNLQIIHGKMSENEKAYAMNEFTRGNSQILLATTVVEVGVDTKASEILILGADRFGLASLHQLRGRVGRDGGRAHCYVYSSGMSDKARKRLELFCAHDDGQYLAEADFGMRGAGEFLGTRQSGSSLTPIFGLSMTANVLKAAKQYADKSLCQLTLDELTALTRRSESKVNAFLTELGRVTLNS